MSENQYTQDKHPYSEDERIETLNEIIASIEAEKQNCDSYKGDSTTNRTQRKSELQRQIEGLRIIKRMPSDLSDEELESCEKGLQGALDNRIKQTPINGRHIEILKYLNKELKIIYPGFAIKDEQLLASASANLGKADELEKLERKFKLQTPTKHSLKGKDQGRE